MEQYKKTYEGLEHLAETAGNDEKIYHRMASVAYMCEDYEAEEQASLKILELNPNSVEGHFLLAQSYIGRSNFVLAIAMLSKALAIDDSFFSANLLRGQALLKIGNLSGATSDVEILMKKMPYNEDTLLLAARLAKAKNELDKAIIYYNRLIDANPFSVVALRERGSVKYEMGDKDGAEADAKAVLEIEPNQVGDISGNYTSHGSEKIQCELKDQ